jgi:hypothetical protein
MDDSCKHPGCQRPKGKALGYCNAHYARQAKGKDMDAPIRNKWATDSERFWEKVDKSGSCWLWTGAKLTGYGSFRLNGGAWLAHRVSYTWRHGDIPEGAEVDHMCHNKACVNPDHLRLASHSANGQNRAASNSNSKSGVRGVYWCNTFGHWIAKAMLNRRPHHIGIFSDLESAAQAVTEWRREHMPYSINDQRKEA